MAGKNFDISKFAATLKPVSESDTMLEISIDDIRVTPETSTRYPTLNRCGRWRTPSGPTASWSRLRWFLPVTAPTV